MGNSLFQLGWKQISGDAYPATGKEPPSMDEFDTMVKGKLDKSGCPRSVVGRPSIVPCAPCNRSRESLLLRINKVHPTMCAHRGWDA
jgi:hypothetical protein